MDLSRAIGKFAQNTIEAFNQTTSLWEDTGIKGGLHAYDRFISDRAFGQKKRILLTESVNQLPIDTNYRLFKVGGDPAIFTLESVNPDIFCDDRYANIYMLHELPYQADIYSMQGGTRASGAPKRNTKTLIESAYADYDRYSSVNSREFNTVDYTVIDLFLPRGTDISTDYFIEMDGMTFDVLEVSTSLNILVCRAQQRGVNGP